MFGTLEVIALATSFGVALGSVTCSPSSVWPRYAVIRQLHLHVRSLDAIE